MMIEATETTGETGTSDMSNDTVPRYLDSLLDAATRARDLIGRMSLEEKMGQVNCFIPMTFDPEGWRSLPSEYPQGVGQISTLQMRMLDTLHEAADRQRELQRLIISLSPHHIPAIFHMEGVYGAYIPSATSLPSGIARGATFDPEAEEAAGHAVGIEERAIGVSETLAPVLDVSHDPRMGREAESYGEDPTLVTAMGLAFLRGVQKEDGSGLRTEAVAKHFTAFHTSTAGIHGAESDVDSHRLRELYSKPFQAAFVNGLRGIMPCYNTLQGEPVSVSKRILTDLMRDEMGFDGIAVSDYCAISNAHAVQHIGETMADTGYRSMEAGMDQELQFQVGFNKELMERFRSGQADIAVLDRAVTRVLEAKFRMGLFEHPYGMDGKVLDKMFHRLGTSAADTSRRLAFESMTLLSNNGVLPLKPGIARIAVVGPHAANARYLFGGYSHLSMEEGEKAAVRTMAGLETSGDGSDVPEIPGTQIQECDAQVFDDVLYKHWPDANTLMDELARLMPRASISYARGFDHMGTDESKFPEALATVADSDVAIITVGGKYGTSSISAVGEGADSTDINLSPSQEHFIEQAAATGTPIVVVHIGGRPISSNAADCYADAILEAWAPARYGFEAIAAVLTGEYNPGGKLPVTVARTAGQTPLVYNHLNGSAWHQGESVAFPGYVDLPHTPRYHFGYGMSYTSFTYHDLHLNRTELHADEVLRVSVTITNTGDCAGDEIVQLYVVDRYASMVRPVMELQGFRRVHDLQPGASCTICFDLPMSALAFTDTDMRWIIEHGTYDVMIGGSSNDLPLVGSFVVLDDLTIDGRARAFGATATVR